MATRELRRIGGRRNENENERARELVVLCVMALDYKYLYK